MRSSGLTGRTARYLAQYWKNAYTIRARGLTLQPVTSNKVVELMAYSHWQEKGWSLQFIANHSMALNQIISRNMDKIRQVREEASYNGLNQERLQELYEKALELQREAEAANHLLEMLNE